MFSIILFSLLIGIGIADILRGVHRIAHFTVIAVRRLRMAEWAIEGSRFSLL